MSINYEEPVSSLKCVSVKENWFSDIEVDRAAWSNSPHVQHLCLRSLLRVCGRYRAAFTLQCFCAGGKSRSSLHAALLHLCCAGSGALWQTRSVILLRVNTQTQHGNTAAVVFELLLDWNLLVNTIFLICSKLACVKMSARSLSFSLSLPYLRRLILTIKGSRLQGLSDLHIGSSIRLLLSTHFFWACASVTGGGIPAKQLNDEEMWLVWNFYFSPQHICKTTDFLISSGVWTMSFFFLQLLSKGRRASPPFSMAPRGSHTKCFLTCEARGRCSFGDLHISLNRLWLSGLVGKGI